VQPEKADILQMGACLHIAFAAAASQPVGYGLGRVWIECRPSKAVTRSATS